MPDSLPELPQQGIYGFNARLDVAPYIPTDVRSVLDIGCGEGGFGSTLRSKLGSEVHLVGVESVASQATAAEKSGNFDRVIHGYYPSALDLEFERFDLLVFNDVLEHMLDPWGVLRASRERLTDRGRVLAAIPNVQYAPVVWDLMHGRWDYTESGTLDRTHVRFFTRETMVEMFKEAGYSVDLCVGINDVRDVWGSDPRRFRRALKLAYSMVLRDSRYLQFAILATPQVAGG